MELCGIVLWLFLNDTRAKPSLLTADYIYFFFTSYCIFGQMFHSTRGQGQVPLFYVHFHICCIDLHIVVHSFAVSPGQEKGYLASNYVSIDSLNFETVALNN